MEFFISNAYAQQGAPQGSLLDLWPLVVIFIAFYFLLIRPQQKKQKAHGEMVAGLQVGDEVMTAGGILGRITGISEHYAVVQISDNTEIKIQKSSVSAVVPKGTFEEA
jgi:preprotein translocase subunit YajC